MFARLALLFVIVPVVELLLLVQMGRYVGLLPTVALVVTTGVVGAYLARLEGFRVLLGARKEVASGRMPTQSLMNGVCILIGGALLLTPGILTDFVGFSLLLPFTRGFWTRRLRAALESGVKKGWLKATVVQVPWGRAPGGPPMPQEEAGFASAEVVETIVNSAETAEDPPEPGRLSSD